jgi:AhpD family alkylhydroperoxidase
MGNEPTIESSRIDSSSHELLTRLSRLGADTFGYKAELSVDKELAQLLRLRVAQINNCTYCLIRHYEAARDLGTSRTKLDTLTAWWETRLFSPAEQAALAYTEALTRASDTTVHSQSQSYHDHLADHFDSAQILDTAFDGVSDVFLAAMTALAAGGVLAMLAETMIPEAFHLNRRFIGAVTASGFMDVLLLGSAAS